MADDDFYRWVLGLAFALLLRVGVYHRFRVLLLIRSKKLS